MKLTGFIALACGALAVSTSARAEALHCYLGLGSNSAPSCAAKPASLDFGTVAVVRVYDTPDFQLELRPSAVVPGAYDSSLVSTKSGGSSTFLIETMIATRQGLVLQADPRAPFGNVKYDQGPGQNLYLRAGAPDFNHPTLVKRVNATLAFMDTTDGSAQLFVGIAITKAIICSKADPSNEAAWRDFVAHFAQGCVN